METNELLELLLINRIGERARELRKVAALQNHTAPADLPPLAPYIETATEELLRHRDLFAAAMLKHEPK